jgi:Tol biopolymer transport system component
MRMLRLLELAVGAAVAAGCLSTAAAAGSSGASSGKIVFSTGGDGRSDTLEIAAINGDGGRVRKLTHVPGSATEPRWSTDGHRIIFLTEDTFTGGSTNWRMRPDGSGRQRLPGFGWDVPSPNGALVQLYDRIVDANGKVVRRLRPGLRKDEYYADAPLWSSDGRFITINVVKLNRDDAELGRWVDVIPTTERGRGVAVTPRRRGQYAGALSWSPDSRRMLIEGHPRRSYDWYTITPDGRDRRFLLLREQLSGNHAWSPDSRRIAYVGRRGGIFVIDASGGRPRRIAATRRRGSDASNVYLDWSSRGEIAFSDKGGTYVMRADGTGLRRLSKRTGQPKWSLNGQKLVLSNAKEIYVIDRRGRERQLTRWLSDRDPQVSPNSRRVAFVRGRGVYIKNPSVYVMNADGSARRRLGPGQRPRWSPDGNRIAYTEDRAIPRNDSIVVADQNGSGNHAVTDGDDPTWSPDGRLAFMRYDYVFEDRGDHGGAQWYVVKSKLVTTRADGSDERTIAAFDADTAEGPIPARAPAWSPDGRMIALVFGGSVLLVDPADGMERRVVDLHGDGADGLEWSLDGSRLLAWDFDTIWAIDPATGTATTILELTGTNSVEDATWSPDGTTIGFVRCNDSYDDCDVYEIAAQAGARPQRLTKTPGIEFDLDWSQ